MDGQGQTQAQGRAAQQHDEGFIALGKLASPVGAGETLGLDAVSAETGALSVTVVAGSCDLYGVAGDPGMAAQEHVFGKGPEPCRKSTQFFPESPRNP